MDSVSNPNNKIGTYILIEMIICEICCIIVLIYINLIASELKGGDTFAVYFFMYWSSTPLFCVLSIIIYILSFVWKMKKFYCARLTLRIINMIPLGLSTSITLHIGKWKPILAPIFYVLVISLEFVYNKMIKKKEDNES